MIVEIKVEFWAGGVVYEATVCLNDNTVEVTTPGAEWRGKWDWNKGAVEFQPYLNLQIAAAVNAALAESPEIKAWKEAEPHIRAFALDSACELDDVTDHDDGHLEIGGVEYFVLTDERADELAKDLARGSIWAFNVNFLSSYVPALRNKRAATAWEKAVRDLCEDAGPLVEALLGDRLDEALEDAVGQDGRGHFISGYDGHENEIKDPLTGERFYVYRQ